MATLQEARNGLRATTDWAYERLGLRSLTYHVPSYANGIPYVLGGITLFGIVILIATGVYLTQFYHPDPFSASRGPNLITKLPPIH